METRRQIVTDRRGRLALQPDRPSIRCALATGVALYLASGGLAAAQDSVPTDGEEPGATRRSDEIIVTAQKREERLIDVPISIAAITGESLEKAGMTSFDDYARSVSGVNAVGGSTRASVIPVIRGVQLGDQAPATAFYLDETPIQPLEYERTGIPDPNIYDIERIEILKGPQGSIYGGNSMGGVVKVIPKAPVLGLVQASVDTSAAKISGGDEELDLRAMLNVPVIDDKLALRLVAYYQRDGGFIDIVPFTQARSILTSTTLTTPEQRASALNAAASRNMNDMTIKSARVALAWEPTAGLRITPTLFYQNIHHRRANLVSSEIYNLDGKGLIAFDFGVPDISYTAEYVQAALKLEGDLSWGNVVSTTSYFTSDTVTHPDSSLWIQNNRGGIPASVPRPIITPSTQDNDIEEWHFTHETRLSTNFDGPLNGLLGIYHRTVRQTHNQFWGSPDFTPFLGTSVLFAKADEYDKLEEHAVFGQATLNLGERVVLEAGARFYKFRRVQRAIGTGLLGFAPREFTGKGDVISPSASATFKITPDNNVYVRAAKGFRPGFGANTALLPEACSAELQALGLTRGPYTVNPDKLWNYEIGTKNRFGRVQFDAAAYQIDWTDLQNSIALACTGAARINIGDARIRGAEARIVAPLSDAITISAGAGYNDPTIRRVDPRVQGLQSGARIGGSPKWTANASIDFRAPVGDDKEAYGLLSYTYNDRFFYGATPNPVLLHPSTSLFTARAGVRWSNWDVSLFSRNLFNTVKRGQCPPASGFAFLSPDFGTCVNEPRTIGINLKRRFGH